jgi:hypothetical protein
MYCRKTAVKDQLCFICSKFTSTVLRNDSDHFYVCDNHLMDSTFCKIIYSPATVSSATEAATEGGKEGGKEANKEAVEAKEAPKEGLLDKVQKSINSGFINNIQKALFTQMEFTNVDDKKQEILGYELTRVFLEARQQSKQVKIRKKEISQKNLDLVSRVDEWPQIPGNDPNL